MTNVYQDAARAQNIRNVGQPVRANPQAFQDQRQIERQTAMRRNRRQGEMDAGVPLDLVGTRQSFAGPGAEQATRSMTQSVPQQTLAAQAPEYAAGIGMQDALDAQANRGVLGVNEGMTRDVLEGDPTQQLADARANKYRQAALGFSDREAQLQQSFDQARSSLLGTPAGLGMGQQAMPMGQQGIDEGTINALRGEMRPLTAEPAPPVAQPAMNMQPAIGPAQMDALRGQLGRVQPAQQAGEIQSAPPRPAPAKVQPAPTAASVGKSIEKAVQIPQKEAQTSQKQKEDAKTGFVPTQRPKPKQGYGQGRA